MAWSLAVTAPNAEFRVADAFVDLAFPHFLFRTRERVVQRGRVVERIVAAFPRYIFVFIPDFGMYRTMIDTIRDVTGFVRDGDNKPWRGDDDVIRAVVERTDSDGFLPVVEIPCPFHAGQRVIVRGDSVITGYQATFHHVVGNGRAVVEQEWLGRFVPIMVNLQDLEPVEERHRKKKRRHRRSRR